MDNAGGKHLSPKAGMPKGAKIAIIAAASLLVLLIGGYCALCAWVNSSGVILPNTVAQVGGDLSGMTREQAAAAIQSAGDALYGARSITVTYPGGEETVPGTIVSVDAAGAADAAFARGRENGFLGLGFAWLFSGRGAEVPVTAALTPAGEAVVADIAAEVHDHIHSTLTETSCTLTETALEMKKGISGMAIAPEDFRMQLMDAFWAGMPALELRLQITAPAEPDFEGYYRQIYTESADAYFDKETKEIVPSVTGVSFDIAEARSLLMRTDEGEKCSLPLILDEPAVTTKALEELLFRDVLAETKTWCSGPASRRGNIDLACSFVNGTILMPGEEFSYNALCGPYSESNGYGKATAYVQGKSVDTVAGGICQLSSTLYWATLVANLETVERAAHRYDSGYMPVLGTDATVFDTSPDFRFKNSTEYPLKIECYRDRSNNCHVKLLGTDTTGIKGEPYSIRLSTTPAEIVYEVNDTLVAPGADPIQDPERTAYTGKVVETYLRLRDKDGKVIEERFLHKNNYRSRDGVYFYNSADAERLGIDPATGKQTLAPVVTDPPATEEPGGETPSPDPTQPTPPPTPIDPGTDPGTESPQPSPSPSSQVPEGIPIIPPEDEGGEVPQE